MLINLYYGVKKYSIIFPERMENVNMKAKFNSGLQKKQKNYFSKYLYFNIALLTSLASAQAMPIVDMGSFVNDKILTLKPTALSGAASSDALYSSIVAGDSSSPFYVTVNGTNYYYDVLGMDRDVLSSLNTEKKSPLSGDYFGSYYNLGTQGDFGVFFLMPTDTVNIINGDFINNIGINGAGVMNFGSVSEISGNFIGNKVFNLGGAEGAGVRNAGTIGSLHGDFIANYSQKNAGGIKNDEGTIGSVSGNFIANSAYLNGGAIYNGATSSGAYGIDKITGSFIGNTAGELGGAIYNGGYFSDMGDVSAIFIQNHSGQHGGAIYNVAKWESLDGIFVSNSAKNLTGDAFGGAIYNDNNIKDLSGLFFGNSAVSDGGIALGGAIYSSSYLYMIAKNGLTLFQDNYVSTDGGTTQISNAIYNTGSININAGYDNTDYDTPKKGAGLVHIKDDITGLNGSITINFGSVADVPTNGVVMIDSNVSGNRLTTVGGYLSFADGVTDEHYTGDRFRLTTDSVLFLDADMANSAIDKINTPDLTIENSTVAFRMLSDSSAGLNELFHENVTSMNFGGISFANAYTNNAQYVYSVGAGLAKTETYTGMEGFKTALTQTGDRTFTLTDDLILTEHNQLYADGELTIFGNVSDKDLLVYNADTSVWGLNSAVDWDDYHKITSNNQYSLFKAWGSNSSINIIDAVFDGVGDPSESSVFYRAAIYSSLPMNVYNSAFLNSSSGGISNDDVLNVFNSYFENIQSAPSTTAGAVTTGSWGVSNIYNSVFVNNKYSLNNSGTTNIYNSIMIGAVEGEILNTRNLNIYAVNGNTIIGDENSAAGIRTQHAETYLRASNGTIYINADSYGNSMLVGNLYIGTDDADGNSYDGTVVVNADMSFLPDTINFDNGILKIGEKMGIDSTTGYSNFFGGDFISNGKGILDTQNGVMDRFDLTAWTLNNPQKVLIDIDLDKNEADFFDNATGKNIEIAGINILNSQALYPNTQISISSAGNSLALAADAKTAIGSIFKYTVDDSDLQSTGFLSLTSDPSKANNFAAPALANSLARSGYLNDVLDISSKALSPNRIIIDQNLYGKTDLLVSAWFDFSGDKEKIKPANISFDTENYTGIAGLDMLGGDVLGFDALYSIYSGYVKSEQNYENVITKQDGFVVGASLTMDRGNLTTATTANFMTSFVKEMVASADAEYNLYSGSIANKTSYDFKNCCNQLVLTPSVLIGYHFISSEDYTNASGLNINSEALHVFNVNPELKLSGYFKGVKPYATIGYNWSVGNAGDIKADGVLLADIIAENYAKASVGLDAYVSKSLSAYIQANATTMEREGLGGQFGFKWQF